MDIEGAELDALQGAQETIAADSPQMAICVYHKPDHIWKIPEFVLSINKEYRIQLKQFNPSNYYDTVMYFIPNKKFSTPSEEKLSCNGTGLFSYCRAFNIKEEAYQSRMMGYLSWSQRYVNRLINEKQLLDSQVAELAEEKQLLDSQVAELAEEKQMLNSHVSELVLETTRKDCELAKLRKELQHVVERGRAFEAFYDNTKTRIMAEMDQLQADIEAMRTSKSYRVSRAIRMISNTLKKPSQYLSFAVACFMRMFGRHDKIDRFAPIMDFPDIMNARVHATKCLCIQTVDSLFQQESELQALYKAIREAKMENRRIICVFAPIFNEENVKDGYYRRIKAIDDMMGLNTLRIYMSWVDCDYDRNIIHVDQQDKYHYSFRYVNDNEKHSEIVLSIAKKSDLVYHHSVGFSNEIVTRCRYVKKIFDLHGALPEEQVMYNNYIQAQRDARKERYAVEYGYRLIGVTMAMAQHIRNKYPQYNPHFIVLPILDDIVINSRRKLERRPYDDGKPTVIYAGGMQKWQMIDKMQEIIRKTHERCVYKIFTVHPEEFWEIWGEHGRVKNLLVESRSPEQLMNEYRDCHYGFLLREETPVNTVACPTKLVEYLIHGIVPVLNTTSVGDFVAEGMKYVSCTDFIENRLPSEEERFRMAQDNLTVIDKMLARYESGKAELTSIFRNMGGKRDDGNE